jgi:hypothetical protein
VTSAAGRGEPTATATPLDRIVREHAERLACAGIPSAQREASLLARHALGVAPVDLVTATDRDLPPGSPTRASGGSWSRTSGCVAARWVPVRFRGVGDAPTTADPSSQAPRDDEPFHRIW